MGNYYSFSVFAPINFYFGGKWYRYRPGDIFKEEQGRAERLLESIPSEERQKFRVNRRTNNENQRRQHSKQHVSLRSESQLHEGSTEESSGQSSEELQQSQQEQNVEEDSPTESVKPVEIQDSIEYVESEDKKQEEEERVSLDEHWATVNKVLNNLLEQEETDWDYVNWICDNFSQYKSVRETCQKIER